MIYAILGDIHANLEALQAVVSDAKKQGVNQFISTGDVVGYNANPSECIAQLDQLNCAFVKGNHDDYSSSRIPLSSFNPSVRDTLRWTRRQLSSKEKRTLKQAPLVMDIDGFTIVHSSLHHPEQWDYVLDIQSATDHFRNQFSPICFIGHSHIPTAFVKNSEIQQGSFQSLTLQSENRYLINVGSVGQPRDHNPDAAYVIYNTILSRIDLRRVTYDRKKTQKKIRAEGLPFRNALRLDRGR
ncbi:MAG: metallophosphoesterase family protein [Pontiellaceae bacterium]